MGLPRVSSLRQSVRWQLAWYDSRHRIDSLGGFLCGFEEFLGKLFLGSLIDSTVFNPACIYACFLVLPSEL